MAFMDDELVSARQEVLTQPMQPMMIVGGNNLRVVSEIEAGAKAHTFEILTQYGVAAVMTSRATNVPQLGDSTEENIVRVFPIKNGFNIDEDQVIVSRRVGRNLITEKLVQARAANDQKLDLIGFRGEPGTTLLGISNYPGITILQLPQTGVDTANANAPSRRLSHKTPMQVLADLNLIASQVSRATSGLMSSNRLLAGYDLLLYLQNTPFNSELGTSIYQIFMANQATLINGVREFVAHPSLDTAGTAGAIRVVGYSTGSPYNKFHIPQGGGWRDSGLDKKGDVWSIETKSNTAGCEIQKIKELIYADVVI
jgi:hypothetical protein